MKKIGTAAILGWLVALNAPTVQAEVSITEVEYEGRPQLQVNTRQATYFFDRSGGGFSRLLDRDGRDWISFHKSPLKEAPAAAAAGFRGIPNLVFGRDNPDAGAGHPGFDQCRSRVEGADTIRTESISGKWAWQWKFTDQHATLTILKTDDAFPYWFLYEGTVGGKWSPQSHYFGTDLGGPRRDLPDAKQKLFERWRWVYFGGDTQQRVLLAAHFQKDDLDDTLWYMGNSSAGIQSEDGMIVFGFGRTDGTKALLRSAGQQFRIGLLEFDAEWNAAKKQEKIAEVAQSWLPPEDDKVSVKDETLFGDLDCFRITTPTATYLYGKRGAGFASILDTAGHDWISYRHGNKAAGEYRGLPKCGQPTKFFHSGYGFGQYANENPFYSKVTLNSPDHVRIHSESKNGNSACDWDFFPTHATLTLTRIGLDAYWFLYEGTPGGKLDADLDFVVRPGNRKTFLNEPWADDVPWVYFGANESASSFFLIDHQHDPAPESYVSWPYKQEASGSFQEMTVFGFGRPNWQDPKQHTPPLTQLPARFSIGFAPTQEYAGVERLVASILSL